MGYQVIDVGALEAVPDRPSTQRRVSDAAGLANVVVNRYEAAPGEQLPLAYHYHDEQEELFYVLDGPVYVETPDAEYVVDDDDAFVVTPGSPHRAYNPADATGSVRVLAVGAPRIDDVHAYEPDEN